MLFRIKQAVSLVHFSYFQLEATKKREQECGRLRKEMEELTSANNVAMANAKSKFNDALTEIQDELDNVKKSKAK